MDIKKSGFLRRLKLPVMGVCVVLAAVVFLVVFTNVLATPEADWVLQFLGLLVEVILFGAIVLILISILKELKSLSQKSAKMEKVAETLEKNRSVLTQINQNTRLSETAKAIAYRDADRQSLREAVFDKLHQQDFDTTYKIIEEIALSPEYKQLAEQLRTEADGYRDATDQERINQVIAHIEKLLENYLWSRASIQIERLIASAPGHERAKEMRQKLVDKKEERKKILLKAWDDAVKRQATDRSLEILRELDLYLTPNEGLALQEAARDIFRSKLHNLGVQFSLDVSEKQWDKAVQTGKQIMRDFPNSRMAGEIREKWDALNQKVGQ